MCLTCRYIFTCGIVQFDDTAGFYKLDAAAGFLVDEAASFSVDATLIATTSFSF
jgi:hypothetical protein